jgi:hypothetical protein
MGIKVDRRAKSSGKLGRAKADREGLAIVAGVDNCWPVPLRLQLEPFRVLLHPTR